MLKEENSNGAVALKSMVLFDRERKWQIDTERKKER